MLYIRKKGGEKTMEQRKEAIICLEGLGKQFQTTNGTVTALDDINLEILQGEIFGIIGLSGAGKSTLVRCINYLETPTAGRVIFEGQNLSMMKESETVSYTHLCRRLQNGDGTGRRQCIRRSETTAVHRKGTLKERCV